MSSNSTSASSAGGTTTGTATATAPKTGKSVRVLVVDDHHLVLEGLRAVLSTDPALEVVGEAHTGREAVGYAELLRPDIVLMDIRMPDMNGIDATRQVKQAVPTASVIMLTMYENPDYLFEAVKAGASGYVLKDVAGPDLLEAIHTVVDGAAGPLDPYRW